MKFSNYSLVLVTIVWISKKKHFMFFLFKRGILTHLNPRSQESLPRSSFDSVLNSKVVSSNHFLDVDDEGFFFTTCSTTGSESVFKSYLDFQC